MCLFGDGSLCSHYPSLRILYPHVRRFARPDQGVKSDGNPLDLSALIAVSGLCKELLWFRRFLPHAEHVFSLVVCIKAIGKALP